ncbi:hypothetical protein VPH35_062968 [Triticum aestivum]
MDLRAESMQGDMYEGKKPEQRLDKSQCWNFFGRCGNLGKGKFGLSLAHHVFFGLHYFSKLHFRSGYSQCFHVHDRYELFIIGSSPERAKFPVVVYKESLDISLFTRDLIYLKNKLYTLDLDTPGTMSTCYQPHSGCVLFKTKIP